MKQIIINNISTSYYITEDGKCYNTKTAKYLKGQVNKKNGYLTYMLTLPDGSKSRQYAHRLVALAYISNNDKYKTQVNHIDGNKENNYVDNLEWVTPQENQQHALQNELRKYNHVFCFNKDKELVAEYINIPSASQATGVSQSIIQQELHKEIKTLSGNFYWSTSNKIDKIKNYINTGKKKTVYQYDLKGKFINKYDSVGQACRSLGLSSHSHISECCRGKLKTYKGFIWRYAEDIVLTLDKSQGTDAATSKK